MCDINSKPTTVKENLKKLERETRDLWYHIKCREKSVDAVEGTLNATEDAVNNLMSLIGNMEHEINECTDKLSELDSKREKLVSERDSLQALMLKRKQNENRTTGSGGSLNSDRIELERAKRDDVREMLLQKRDELEFAKDRKRHVENKIISEWDKLRDEYKKVNDMKKSVLDEIDSADNKKIENLKIARDLTEGEDRESIEESIEWLNLCKEERDLTHQLNQLEFEVDYESNETNKALAIKKRYMNRLEEISREHHEIMVRDGVDTGFYMKEAKPCVDLSIENTDSLMMVESLSDVGEDIEDTITLHRCDQEIDLHTNVEMDEDLKRYAEELEQNMAEYMEELNLNSENKEAEMDVQGTVYPDTEDNLQDAAREYIDEPEVADEKPEPKVPATHVQTRPSAMSHMESSEMDPTLSMKARMISRLGLGEKNRGGSQVKIRNFEMKATGSGTFGNFWKK
ncbi:hypothetical protein LOTGIDRAFT_231405 [Lottia gigantea]|uniref:Uncharacterized protein n=1 Tax=Lottia gigantea TaxID=225164 RepID=V4A3D6_LOTGI|nr:hypothetical protein LOTGIDRAFT_231405 [Lottia gigantea]ESO98338.1 hypothetical protein LOTGIDRAFT_231405 [Lottia gigantea]